MMYKKNDVANLLLCKANWWRLVLKLIYIVEDQ